MVGAGPSGASAALFLARAGHRVAVFDRAAFPRDKACGEGLMPPGVAVLRRLGLLEAVLGTGARRIDAVAYSARGGTPTACAAFPAPPEGGEAWALGVRRTTFDSTLVDALRAESTIELHEAESVTGVLRGAGGVSGITTARGEHWARVIIVADGLHSRMRSWAGLSTAPRRRGRYGLAGHWRADVSSRARITVTFAVDHEWYTAPVGDTTLLVSVLGTRQVIGSIARNYHDAARAAIPELRAAEQIGAPLAAGLFQQRARAVAGGSCFLVGDAAGYEDPTTGEGLAIGMQLGERAAVRVGAVLRGDSDMRTAESAYIQDHAALWNDRLRVTRLALLMARNRVLHSRAIRHASADPAALVKLLAINCGYTGFAALNLRDWLALAGI